MSLEIDDVLKAIEIIRPLAAMIPNIADGRYPNTNEFLSILFEAASEVRSLIAEEGQEEALRLKLEEKIQASIQERLDKKFGGG